MADDTVDEKLDSTAVHAQMLGNSPESGVETTEDPASVADLEFSYQTSFGRDTMVVGVNPDHYYKGLTVIERLHRSLRDAIPFEFKVLGEAEVSVMGGDRRRRIILLEMTIRPAMDVADAVVQLENAGFSRGFEPEIS